MGGGSRHCGDRGYKRGKDISHTTPLLVCFYSTEHLRWVMLLWYRLEKNKTNCTSWCCLHGRAYEVAIRAHTRRPPQIYLNIQVEWFDSTATPSFSPVFLLGWFLTFIGCKLERVALTTARIIFIWQVFKEFWPFTKKCPLSRRLRQKSHM